MRINAERNRAFTMRFRPQIKTTAPFPRLLLTFNQNLTISIPLIYR